MDIGIMQSIKDRVMRLKYIPGSWLRVYLGLVVST